MKDLTYFSYSLSYRMDRKPDSYGNVSIRLQAKIDDLYNNRLRALDKLKCNNEQLLAKIDRFENFLNSTEQHTSVCSLGILKPKPAQPSVHIIYLF
ncbi:hypothetical protein EG68_12253 [Paragonimus skrjabini miyazakii]|uniref:Uncharacterized protein n=1 Tax=Paragonimus skrjabini miyazakii TaxID=59628 RepID=A0A8S9YCK7_9TREM|nr:hypothetical protein EG68_12253 [Paragonimus skrjabini miyazakii]